MTDAVAPMQNAACTDRQLWKDVVDGGWDTLSKAQYRQVLQPMLLTQAVVHILQTPTESDYHLHAVTLHIQPLHMAMCTSGQSRIHSFLDRWIATCAMLGLHCKAGRIRPLTWAAQSWMGVSFGIRYNAGLAKKGEGATDLKVFPGFEVHH